MNNIVHVAFVGAGYIAEWHLKAIASAPGVRLAAVCDKNLGRARALAQRVPGAKAYGAIEDLLAGEKLDAVHVLLPPEHHFAAAKAALEGGVATLLEKPMCTTVEECDELIELAARRGVPLGVAHNFLFHPAYTPLRADLAAGALGRIDSLRIEWGRELGQVSGGPFEGWLFAAPENVMLEVGPHSASQLLDLLGEPDGELSVRASAPIDLPGNRRCWRHWEVSAAKGTAVASMSFSFGRAFTEHVVRVRGTAAGATADLVDGAYLLKRHRPLSDDFDRFGMMTARGARLVSQAHRNLAAYLMEKLKLSRQGNHYGVSIANCVRAFYQGAAAGTLDRRISAAFGRSVIALSKSIGAAAKLPPNPGRPARPALAAAPARVLVLGGTGFIGAELVRQLAARGPVRALARSLARLDGLEGVEAVRGDAGNPADLERAMRGIECVVHLARSNVKTWQDYTVHEIGMTERVADAALAAGVKRFIYSGTIDSYYAGGRGDTITEETPLDPEIHRRNLYARAKALSEQSLLRRSKEAGLPLVIVRPGIVVGRGGSPFHFGVGMWWHNAVCELWGDGLNPLPFVLVEDVAAGLIAAMEQGGIEGESFNLVDEPLLSGRDYIDELCRHARIRVDAIPTSIARLYATDMFKYAVKVLVRFPERHRPSYRDWSSRTQRARFDGGKARARLGWRPASDRAELVRRGIHLPIDEFFR